MIQIKTFSQLTWPERNEFSLFIANAAKQLDPAAPNMKDLVRLLSTRFNVTEGKGCFFVAFEDGEIIGCSGCYISDFDDEVGVLGARTWMDLKWRNKQIVRDYLLPAQRDWMVERAIKMVIITFNEYNRNVRELFERQIVKRVPRTPRHLFYRNQETYPEPLLIQGTAQWVMYEVLDDSIEIDSYPWYKLYTTVEV